MKIIRRKKDLDKFKKRLKPFSFVPTMGGLHEGHEFLIKKAQKKTKKVLVSIFINPKQFNSKIDFSKYPRNLKRDIKILKKLKVDYLYCPNKNDMFSFKTKNKIYLHPFSKKLCGKFRPGHFRGVINVINRFIELLKPKYILLGNKDFQQLVLVKKHILKSKIESIVIPCKTIRSKAALPFSSRNNNLDVQSKLLASKIFRLIKNEKKVIKNNKVKRITLSNLKKRIFDLGIKKIDYIEAINLYNLKKAKKFSENFNIFSAFYVNKVRLIDNF